MCSRLEVHQQCGEQWVTALKRMKHANRFPPLTPTTCTNREVEHSLKLCNTWMVLVHISVLWHVTWPRLPFPALGNNDSMQLTRIDLPETSSWEFQRNHCIGRYKANTTSCVTWLALYTIPDTHVNGCVYPWHSCEWMHVATTSQHCVMCSASLHWTPLGCHGTASKQDHHLCKRPSWHIQGTSPIHHTTQYSLAGLDQMYALLP